MSMPRTSIVAGVVMERTEERRETRRLRTTWCVMRGAEKVSEHDSLDPASRRSDVFNIVAGKKYRLVNFVEGMGVLEKANTKAFVDITLPELRASGTDVITAVVRSGREYLIKTDYTSTTIIRTTPIHEWSWREVWILYCGMKASPYFYGMTYGNPNPTAYVEARWDVVPTKETPIAVPFWGNPERESILNLREEDDEERGTSYRNIAVGKLAEMRETEGWGKKVERRFALYYERWNLTRSREGSEEWRTSARHDGRDYALPSLVLPPVYLSEAGMKKGRVPLREIRDGERVGVDGAFVIDGWNHTRHWDKFQRIRDARENLKRELAERVFHPERVARIASAHGMEADAWLERV